MSNYENKLNLRLYRIGKDNVEDGLAHMIADIDSDFEEEAPAIAREIYDSNTTIIGAIEDALNMRTSIELADMSQFLLQNKTYCKEYDYIITSTTDDSDDFIVALAFIT